MGREFRQAIWHESPSHSCTSMLRAWCGLDTGDVGLGLAIVRDASAYHGGKLLLENREAKRSARDPGAAALELNVRANRETCRGRLFGGADRTDAAQESSTARRPAPLRTDINDG